MEGCGFTDFSFRGETLSDHGYIIGTTDSSSSMSVVTTDSQKSFVSMSMLGGKRFPFLYTVYGGALVIGFTIFKDPDAETQIITPAEAAELKRWLNAPTSHEFKFLDDDYSQYHWYGSFNVEELRVVGECVGFRLTFTSTAPFAYKSKVTHTGSVSADGHITIIDTSDEEGYIYPDLSLTLSSAGDLTITNSYDGRQTVIEDCTNGETIVMTRLQQILTDDSNHNISDSFNYKFVRIGNDYESMDGYKEYIGVTTTALSTNATTNPITINSQSVTAKKGDVAEYSGDLFLFNGSKWSEFEGANMLSFSLPCTVSLSYEPIAKVVFS